MKAMSTFMPPWTPMVKIWPKNYWNKKEDNEEKGRKKQEYNM
jgi:hypothetical protein